MSQRLISLSPDLRRLRDEGYEVAVVEGHLVMTHVPYVDAKRRIGYGALVSELTLSGDVTARPDSHVAYFAGGRPCDTAGEPLTGVLQESGREIRVGPDLVARHMLSSRPTPSGSYPDYYEKMTTYAAILAVPVELIDPAATARSFRPVLDDGEGAFNYVDTASSRAGISTLSQRLAAVRAVAIVGLGGTGSYILDLVAKTPVRRIHLFDADDYLQHNAFRSPGAPTADELRRRRRKVDRLAEQYSAMHRGIVPHAYHLDRSNAAELDRFDFVFLAIDQGPAKRAIVERLELAGVPFIDAGMGVYEADGRLAGLVRVTVSTGPPAARETARARISFGDADAGPYDRDIQIADLNALNAALAVIAWKKLAGFYNDLAGERFAVYAIDTNSLINEDHG